MTSGVLLNIAYESLTLCEVYDAFCFMNMIHSSIHMHFPGRKSVSSVGLKKNTEADTTGTTVEPLKAGLPLIKGKQLETEGGLLPLVDKTNGGVG